MTVSSHLESMLVLKIPEGRKSIAKIITVRPLANYDSDGNENATKQNILREENKLCACVKQFVHLSALGKISTYTVTQICVVREQENRPRVVYVSV